MILRHLINSKRICDLESALRSGEKILIEELWNSTKALVAALAQQSTGKNILILTGASQEEVRLFHDFNFFTQCPVVDFPSWETLPSENIPPSPDIVGERYKVLRDLVCDKQPRIILTGLQACLQALIPPQTFNNLHLSLKINQTIPFDDLIEKLIAMGYQRKSIASDKGEYAIRGGIVDVFPISSPDPFRIEFWGDEVESIRIYDPIGQTSIRPIESIDILPAQELEFLSDSNELASILDYLGSNTIVIFDDLLALEDRYASLISQGSHGKAFRSIDAFLDQLDPLQKIFLTPKPIEELGEVRYLDAKKKLNAYSDHTSFNGLSFDMFNRNWTIQRWRHPFRTIAESLVAEDQDVNAESLLAGLAALSHDESELHIFCSSELEETNLQKRIADLHLILPKDSHYHIGYLSSGFVIEEIKYTIFPTTELTHRYKIRRQKLRSTYHTSPVETFDLLPGDVVVHFNNGIGRYVGVDKRVNHLGVPSEFFTIEYADKAKLFVPVNQSSLLTKYIGADEETVKLHTLGSTRWKNTRESTERAILGYAADLLKMHAERAVYKGFSCPPDSPDYHSFEEEFPFVETEDQLAAIASIKADMMSDKSMDRLVCGDVGYGKTEVAMRAAFKAVVDGRKQVAVLVPTTVLAMQHYENFLERMSNFPINVGVLSRFRTAKQIRETLEGVASGAIDIVIGTHRVISSDVVFKDLGLVIIDEEQRFGVRAKEYLKHLKRNVDCLTLSATPIPRTLYMSLVGARDMSLINTPPQDRLPIKTIIAEPDDQTIKNALLRELARDGQAFIIHNRVESIFAMAARIKKLLPQARVIVAHGQMDPDEIDSAFHAFKNGQADILIATTIVENGIDIPNANTILIDRADHFGLAALYQLRGRVGRWNRRAYAYFLVSSTRSLTEIARKRLNALTEAGSYGGGMIVAKRDLEMRGAGNMLGTEQTGFVESIGFHLFCKMLKRAVHALQGKIPSIVMDCKVELNIDARIPEEYVDEISLRMEIYQRLGEALSWEEVDVLWEEIKDRFGKPPAPAEWLYHTTRIRVFAARNGFSLIKQEKLSLILEKKNGKDVTVRKILIPKIKSAPDFEKFVVSELGR